jgi:hypothetical protein
MAGGGKRKVSLTLDADLLDALDLPPRALSARVNAALRQAVEEEQYLLQLKDWADRLYAEHGLDTPEDEAEISRLMALGRGDPSTAAAPAAAS